MKLEMATHKSLQPSLDNLLEQEAFTFGQIQAHEPLLGEGSLGRIVKKTDSSKEQGSTRLFNQFDGAQEERKSIKQDSYLGKKAFGLPAESASGKLITEAESYLTDIHNLVTNNYFVHTNKTLSESGDLSILKSSTSKAEGINKKVNTWKDRNTILAKRVDSLNDVLTKLSENYAKIESPDEQKRVLYNINEVLHGLKEAKNVLQNNKYFVNKVNAEDEASHVYKRVLDVVENKDFYDKDFVKAQANPETTQEGVEENKDAQNTKSENEKTTYQMNDTIDLHIHLGKNRNPNQASLLENISKDMTPQQRAQIKTAEDVYNVLNKYELDPSEVETRKHTVLPSTENGGSANSGIEDRVIQYPSSGRQNTCETPQVDPQTDKKQYTTNETSNPVSKPVNAWTTLKGIGGAIGNVVKKSYQNTVDTLRKEGANIRNGANNIAHTIKEDAKATSPKRAGIAALATAAIAGGAWLAAHQASKVYWEPSNTERIEILERENDVQARQNSSLRAELQRMYRQQEIDTVSVDSPINTYNRDNTTVSYQPHINLEEQITISDRIGALGDIRINTPKGVVFFSPHQQNTLDRVSYLANVLTQPVDGDSTRTLAHYFTGDDTIIERNDIVQYPTRFIDAIEDKLNTYRGAPGTYTIGGNE
ncbi:MAG: hypothetical protein ACMXYC_02140 [Candidatus Woesearchaeota archaeon]